MSETTKRERGRPTKKNPEAVRIILDLVAKGKTEHEISEITGLSRSTLWSWKVKDWEFSEQLKDSKDFASQLVEASLFKKAMGFEHKITQQSVTKDGQVIDYDQTLYIPPSDTSIIFWLKNQRNGEWKDRREEDHTITLKKEEALRELSTEELLEETQKLLEAIKAETDGINRENT
jgi:hypothetical protein